MKKILAVTALLAGMSTAVAEAGDLSPPESTVKQGQPVLCLVWMFRNVVDGISGSDEAADIATTDDYPVPVPVWIASKIAALTAQPAAETTEPKIAAPAPGWKPAEFAMRAKVPAG